MMNNKMFYEEAGDIPQCSSNPWMKYRIVDHGKLPPDPQSGQLFTLGAMPGVVSVCKKTEPRKEAAPLPAEAQYESSAFRTSERLLKIIHC
ncbi:uncharacterized protein [Periplaneta americana]|uniref:uncharacterized protein isoform X2 n=1 Tax=Periplaneta americana TaxID=6978 RepID=UPI0037E7281C